MTRQLLIVALVLAIPCLAVAQTTIVPLAKAGTASRPKAAAGPYGSNPAAGKTFVHDDVTLYAARMRGASGGSDRVRTHGMLDRTGSIPAADHADRLEERVAPRLRLNVEPIQRVGSVLEDRPAARVEVTSEWGGSG